ncbi:hypothetical protein [Sporomusa termitida]|uniref:Uncharacterized protein n=1 Tax=Sporomusa termitida TaxID=2377 RepID=A0A517DU56_9FIRM|nr:hypothetical protein [Sporomusa termitida]QDR80877.1 hypothetical protein SPTER_22150 [Sporomusa termitida]
MPNDTDNPGSSSLLGSITRMLDANSSAGAGSDNLITVLALLCLFSIVNKNNNAISQPGLNQPAANSNPLHKLLGELTKGGDGGGGGIGGSGFSPDTLMSLLPLLNSPQLKSKLNPGTISTVLGLLNNLGGLGGPAQDKPKAEPKPEPQKQPRESEPAPPAPVADPQSVPALKQQPIPAQEAEEPDDPDSKNFGRYLNWKNNF